MSALRHVRGTVLVALEVEAVHEKQKPPCNRRLPRQNIVVQIARIVVHHVGDDVAAATRARVPRALAPHGLGVIHALPNDPPLSEHVLFPVVSCASVPRTHLQCDIVEHSVDKGLV